ncbi:Hypothetical predicted protein, partial [Paramuricea clavata]
HNRHAETHHETNNLTENLRPFNRTMADLVNKDLKTVDVDKDVRVNRKVTKEQTTQNFGDNVYTEKSELHWILERQTLLMERQLATVERFTTGMELPKREFRW